jgi:hypothetical protein
MSKNYIPIKFHDNFSLWLNQTSHEICLEWAFSLVKPRMIVIILF